MRKFFAIFAIALSLTAGSTVLAQDPGGELSVVDGVLASMTPREKVGQLFVVGFWGPSVDDSAASFFSEHKVGGVFINRVSCNIKNGPDLDPKFCGFQGEATEGIEQVRILTQELQEASCAATRGTIDGEPFCLPMLISVDHEGDDRTLTRLLTGFTSLPSNMAIGATFDPQQAHNVGCIVGRELASAGVNVLFGPVLDLLDAPVSGGPGDQGVRSFGGSPLWVAEMGAAYVDGVHDCGAGRVATMVKHFPGHGRSTRYVDYEDIPVVVDKSLAQLSAEDLTPFTAVTGGVPGTGPQTDGIMNSHLSYPDVSGCESDPPVPVTFNATCMATFMSIPALAQWRAQGGVTVADDLASGAAAAYAGAKFNTYLQANVAEEALLAGNDLLPLIRQWQWEDLGPTIDYIVLRYQNEPLVRERVDDAARRIISLKLRLAGSLEPADVTRAPEIDQNTIGAAAMSTLSARSATFIQPDNFGAYRRATSPPGVGQQILFVECWSDPLCAPPAPNDVNRYPPLWPRGKLEDLAIEMYPGRTSGLSLRTMTFSELNTALSFGGDLRESIDAADWIVFAFLERDRRYQMSGAIKDFLGRGGAVVDLRSKQIVVFALNSPYHLDAGELRNVDLFLAMYSKTETALRTALKVLFQDPAAVGSVGGGRLPVDYKIDNFTLYDLEHQVSADPTQSVEIAVEPDSVEIGDEAIVSLTSPLIANNGYRVPNGTKVVFELGLPDGTVVEHQSATEDGRASVSASSSVAGEVTIAVSSGQWQDTADASIEVLPGELAGPVEVGDGESSSGFPVLFVASSGASVAVITVAAGGLIIWQRRRPSHTQGPILSAAPASQGSPTALLVDSVARRVLVLGRVLDPPLSREQFALLSYLYGRADQLCSRQEIIEHVWPNEVASGVSDQAVAALVHRIRDRLRSAGVEEQLIVTVRGQGFRLEAGKADDARSAIGARDQESADSGVTRVSAPTGKTFSSGRYVVARLLGQGTEKSVFLVEDQILGRRCALSILNPDLLREDDIERIKREARTLAGFGTQPNIVTVFDYGEENGAPFLVCEYVPGGELRDELDAAKGPLPTERALSVAGDICLALSFAHRLNIVHRDLKPENVWLTEERRAKLGDFGIALALAQTRLTAEGRISGTASYMSPEQASGGDVDQRSDLYSLGAMLYELLTGRAPFTGDSPDSIMYQHINVEPKPPSEHNPAISKRLEQLVLKLMAKSKTDRYSSADDVLAEIAVVSRELAGDEGDLLTILFTDMESSTSLADRVGDNAAQEVRLVHNDIVRSALTDNSGNEIKHTGDGIMASFATASSALDAAIAIQRGVAAHKDENPVSPLGVYVGLNAGEPIAEDDDLFGTSINLAARICDHAEAGQIVASNVVRELAAGKDFLFSDLGETELRGFEDPVKLWELSWQADN